MKLLLYRGKGIISRSIRWQTRSKYSHAAIMLDDGTTYESWHKGGVRKVSHPWEDHDPTTLIDVYSVDRPLDTVAMLQYLESQLGKKYDFKSIGRFLTRRDAPANDKLFCSEYALEAFYEGGVELLCIEPSHCSPAHLAMSPLLQFERTIDHSSDL